MPSVFGSLALWPQFGGLQPPAGHFGERSRARGSRYWRRRGRRFLSLVGGLRRRKIIENTNFGNIFFNYYRNVFFSAFWGRRGLRFLSPVGGLRRRKIIEFSNFGNNF